jgi:hypothetical protein
MSKHYAVVRLAIEPQMIKGPHGNLQTCSFYGWMGDLQMARRALVHWRRHYPHQHTFLIKAVDCGWREMILAQVLCGWLAEDHHAGQ